MARAPILLVLALASASLVSCASGLRSTGPPLSPALVQVTGLWAQDPALSSPRLTDVRTTDNAIVLQWEDGNTTHDGYRVFLDGTGAHATFYEVSASARSAWFVARKVLVPTVGPGGVATSGQGTATDVGLVPGATHAVTVMATSPSGVSASGPAASANAVLTAPLLRIGDPASSTEITPPAVQPFAVWDENGNGIVDSDPNGGGAFPRFPDAAGAQPTVRQGNAFDSSQGVRANVVVGYFFDEGAVPRFVAFHMHVDESNAVTPVSVLYGDAAPGVPGNRVWVSPPGSVVVQNLEITDGVPVVNLPNLVRGTVTAGALASDGSTRVVEFSFLLALEPQ